jgi:hypothetical protein
VRERRIPPLIMTEKGRDITIAERHCTSAWV